MPTEQQPSSRISKYRLTPLGNSASEPHRFLGCDAVHPFVMKEAAVEFARPFSLIFQHSLNSGEVPRAWLEANVTPIFKKGSQTDPHNYRPISLTMIVCKLLEKIIKRELIEHLTQNDLLCSELHGFVRSWSCTTNRSCTTNLLESLDLATHFLSKKYHVDLLFLNFAKAFEKVHHPCLLLKLERYEVKGKILSWIKAFLTHTRQRVVIGETVSDWVPVSSGFNKVRSLVPHYSPYLSTIFQITLSTTCRMFADDTKLIVEI